MIENLEISIYKKLPFAEEKIHSFVANLQKDLHFSIENLSINFVSDDEILAINTEFLKHEYTTDIITFNYEEDTENLDGEIYISLDTAQENATYYNTTLADELTRLIIHGFLHLVGFDDKEEDEKIEMKQKEDYYLKKLKHILD